MSIMIFPITTYASENNNLTVSRIISSNMETKSDKIGYQYKKSNGKIYKRLYNFTKNKPLSEWELVE